MRPDTHTKQHVHGRHTSMLDKQISLCQLWQPTANVMHVTSIAGPATIKLHRSPISTSKAAMTAAATSGGQLSRTPMLQQLRCTELFSCAACPAAYARPCTARALEGRLILPALLTNAFPAIAALLQLRLTNRALCAARCKRPQPHLVIKCGDDVSSHLGRPAQPHAAALGTKPQLHAEPWLPGAVNRSEP